MGSEAGDQETCCRSRNVLPIKGLMLRVPTATRSCSRRPWSTVPARRLGVQRSSLTRCIGRFVTQHHRAWCQQLKLPPRISGSASSALQRATASPSSHVAEDAVEP
eukprot:5935665-Pyramimonas_sp.AAC.1